MTLNIPEDEEEFRHCQTDLVDIPVALWFRTVDNEQRWRRLQPRRQAHGALIGISGTRLSITVKAYKLCFKCPMFHMSKLQAAIEFQAL